MVADAVRWSNELMDGSTTPGEDGRGAGSGGVPEERGTPVGRRVVLGMLGLGALGVATGATIQNGLDNVLASISSKDPTGITGLLPGGGGFQFYNVAGSIPHRTAETYRLTVDGLVDRPATYTLAELRAMPQTRLVRDVQCVTGWRVPHTAWAGVTLAHLLDLAGVQPRGKALRFTCFDG